MTPTPEGAPWQWSAAEVAGEIRAGRLSSVEATTSSLDRIRSVNGRLNALVDLDEDRALAAARRADERAAEGGPLGPLHGVPTAVKINTDVAGEPTDNGIAAYRDDVARGDSAVAAALREAGAVFVGRNNAPAFSFRWFTDNAPHGRTLNPWDARRTPGGSSGGAASAVASGMVPVAHGNDIGGSIRYPAFACGIAGIRPTVGRIPARGGGRRRAARPSLSRQLMSTQGPLARTVGDLALALEAMSSTDTVRDVMSVPAAGSGIADRSASAQRVGIVRDVEGAGTDPALLAALDAAAGTLADAGIEIVEITAPELAEAHRLWSLLLLEDMRAMRETMREVGDPDAVAAMEHMFGHAVELWGAEPSGAQALEGWTRRNELLLALGERFAETPVILTPPSAQLPFVDGTDTAGGERTAAMFAAQWPATSLPVLGLPGVTVPTAVTSADANGMPLGVQLVGPRFSEARLLGTAQLIEDAAGAPAPIDPR